MWKFIAAAFLTFVPFFASPAQKQSKNEEAQKISLCELQKNPPAYNHKLIEVTGFVSHGFESFSIFDPDCPSTQGIWLEYGGKEASGTIYCCGVTSKRTRPKQLVVEKIPVTLEKDDNFTGFDKLIQDAPDTIVRATIAGRFFSGEKQVFPNATFWGGYGHMGCCSLLAIQKVVAFERQDRDDVDYRASADQPDIKKSGGFRIMFADWRSKNELIELQKKADLGQREWSFKDPQQVAAEKMAQLMNIDEKSIKDVKPTAGSQGRFVYRWTYKDVNYMIVVSRPYWLSFYAKNPKRVAWVVIAAYEITG